MCRKAHKFTSLTLIVLTMTLILTGCQSADIKTVATKPSVGPKYVFLLIGDGMGPVQIEAASEYKKSISGEAGPLAMETLPIRHETTTHSANSSVTDSAASGTAISCGHKTNNGMLGQLPDGTKLTSLAEIARDSGKKVGIITSVPTNHATPAAFYAHVKSRHNYNEIAKQFIDSNFDLLAGGGVNWKGDREEIFKIYENAGYTIAAGPEQMQKLQKGTKCVIVAAKNVTQLDMDINAKPESLRLDAVTAKAIELLDGEDGFFMMVEGGMIDWSGHNNDAAANVRETLAFDEAVKVALDFYELHPDETLVMITADHETGGMALAEDRSDLAPLSSLAEQKCDYGTLKWEITHLKESEYMDWQKVSSIIIDKVGLGKLSREEALKLQNAWMESMLSAEDQKKLGWSKYHPLVETALKIKAARAGITWSTHGHTATKIITAAIGVGAEQFDKPMDNTGFINCMTPEMAIK